MVSKDFILRRLFHVRFVPDLFLFLCVSGPLSTPKPPQHHVTQPAQMLNVLPTLTVSTLKNCATPNAIPGLDSVTGKLSSSSEKQ